MRPRMEYKEFKRIQKLWYDENKNYARAIYRIVKYFGQIRYYDVLHILDIMNDKNCVDRIKADEALHTVAKSEWIKLEVMEGAFISMNFSTRGYMITDNKK